MSLRKNKETVLYATKIEDEDWQEQIITTNPAKLTEASEWAKANGFNHPGDIR